MVLRKGSVGWLAAVQVANNLRDQANNLQSGLEEPGNILSDDEFALIVALALDYWNFDFVRKLPEGIGLGNVTLDWRNGKNLPDRKVRRKMIKLIINDLRERESQIRRIADPKVANKSS